MPRWLQILAGLAGLANLAIAGAYFFDRYFRTRKAAERDLAMKQISDRSWTPEDRIDLEHRLTGLEGDVKMLKEIQELRDKINAVILKGSSKSE